MNGEEQRIAAQPTALEIAIGPDRLAQHRLVGADAGALAGDDGEHLQVEALVFLGEIVEHAGLAELLRVGIDRVDAERHRRGADVIRLHREQHVECAARGRLELLEGVDHFRAAVPERDLAAGLGGDRVGEFLHQDLGWRIARVEGVQQADLLLRRGRSREGGPKGPRCDEGSEQFLHGVLPLMRPCGRRVLLDYCFSVFGMAAMLSTQRCCERVQICDFGTS